MGTFAMRHFLDIDDVSADAIRQLLDRALELKAMDRARQRSLLAGKAVALVFEKPSLRTRASFEAASLRLGATALFYPAAEVGLGKREPLADFARVMSQYVDALVLRVYAHATVLDVAGAATIPVVNGLSDLAHPCQALADLLTVLEADGRLDGQTITFVGDGNNVARSLARSCAMLGLQFVLACPDGYGFDDGFVAGLPGVSQTTDPAAAVAAADFIYTDVWTSMGQEAERADRLSKFAAYQVNDELLRSAPGHTRILHCMPAHRGEEISASVLDGPRSLALPQAANRLHAQAALLADLLG